MRFRCINVTILDCSRVKLNSMIDRVPSHVIRPKVNDQNETFALTDTGEFAQKMNASIFD